MTVTERVKRWFVALWRLPWLALQFPLLALMCACEFLAYGPRAAVSRWRDVA